MYCRHLPIPDPKPAVLIVEDEVASRKALSLLLSSCGYTTSACASAEEALKYLKQAPAPEFALVDLDLPGMNGLELIGRLRELDQHVVPVLITAADSDRVRRAMGSATGDRAISYFQKPLDFSQLLVLLSEQQAKH